MSLRTSIVGSGAALVLAAGLVAADATRDGAT